MNINVIYELCRLLKEIEVRIEGLEKSSNCALELLEYDTVKSFHNYNLSFKQFWLNYIRYYASHQVQYYQLYYNHMNLYNRYVRLLKKQIIYLGKKINSDDNRIKGLSGGIFCQDRYNDIVSYYLNYHRNATDEDGKPLYNIDIDRDYLSEEVDGIEVPIDYYRFKSDIILDFQNESLVNMHKSLGYLLDLINAVSSYPIVLTDGYKLNIEEMIIALENESRQYAKVKESKVELDLKSKAQYKKSSRHSQLTPDVWGKVLEEEDEIYRLAISGQLEKNNEERFKYINEKERKLLTKNKSLLQIIMSSAIDEELFDISHSFKIHNLLSSLNAENLNLFYHLVLRRNIIQRNMCPEKLDDEYKKWLNTSEEQQPGDDPTPEEKIKRSLERLMQERIKVEKNGKENEESLFNLQNHWQGVYRILVDKNYCHDADFVGFDTYICKVMPKVVNKPYTKESVKQISKTDFNIPFEKWKYDGETSGKRKVYDRMYAVTNRFKEILEEEGL